MDTREIRQRTEQEVREVVARHAQRSREAGFQHISIRYANDVLNELFGTEYTSQYTPLYNAIYRPGQLATVTGSPPLLIEEGELVRWLLEDFTGPRP